MSWLCDATSESGGRKTRKVLEKVCQERKRYRDKLKE
jgi:hypothetical protein